MQVIANDYEGLYCAIKGQRLAFDRDFVRNMMHLRETKARKVLRHFDRVEN